MGPVFTRHLEAAFDLAWNTKRKNAAFAAAQKGFQLREAGAPTEKRIQCYREAFRLAPEEGVYVANLASALSEAGQYGEAKQVADKAVKAREKGTDLFFLNYVLKSGFSEAELNRLAQCHFPVHRQVCILF